MDLEWILEPIWELFGVPWGGNKGEKGATKASSIKNSFWVDSGSPFGRVLGGLLGGSGAVLGRFGESKSSLWAFLGDSWAPPGSLERLLCNFGVSGKVSEVVLGALGVLCRVLLGSAVFCWVLLGSAGF